jgi:hypothetical protein
MTNATSYRARLGQSKEARDAKQLDLSVKQSSVQLMKEILDAEGRTSEALQILENLKNSPKLNFRQIVEAEANYQAEGEILGMLIDLQIELFAEDLKEINLDAPVAKSSERKPAKKAAGK